MSRSEGASCAAGWGCGFGAVKERSQSSVKAREIEVGTRERTYISRRSIKRLNRLSIVVVRSLAHPQIVSTQLIRNPQLPVRPLLQRRPNLIRSERRNLRAQIVDHLLIDHSEALDPLPSSTGALRAPRSRHLERRQRAKRPINIPSRCPCRLFPAAVPTAAREVLAQSSPHRRLTSLFHMIMRPLPNLLNVLIRSGGEVSRKGREEVRGEVLLKPGELTDFVQFDALVGVDGEHAGKEGTGVGGEEGGEGENTACAQADLENQLIAPLVAE